MAWIVDTCVVLDLALGDPVFEPTSRACLLSLIPAGLAVCSVTFVELGPTFRGDAAGAHKFLNTIRISTSEPWTSADDEVAHQLWYQYQAKRKALTVPKRPVADILIAAFASRFQGLVTRNGSDFRNLLPGLAIIEP